VALARRHVSLLLLGALCACAPRVPFGDDRSAVAIGGAGGGGGSSPDPSSSPGDLAPNTGLNLGRYECTDLAGSAHPCQTINDYSRFVYDDSRAQLLWFGGGNRATSRTDVSAFSLRTLTWQSAYLPTPCADMVPENADLTAGAWTTTGHPMSRQTFDMLVMADSTHELVLLTYNAPGMDCGAWPVGAPNLDAVPGRVAHYDPDTRAWRFSAAAADLWPMDAAAEYDPESGLILVLGTQDLWTYDPVSELAQHRLSFDLGQRFGYAAELVYFPPTRRFYYFTRDGLVFEITVDRQDWGATSIVEITDASGALPAADAKGWAYDTVNQVIGGGVRDSVFYQFEPATRVWTASEIMSETGARPGNVAFFTLAYAAQASVFLFFTDYDSGWATWAYRP
jgi:hypothetical protein